MRFKIITFSMLLSGLSGLGSCSSDKEDIPDSVYLYKTSTDADAAGLTRSLTVYTTCAWSTSADSWISVEPSSGSEKGIHVVTINCEANTSGEVRKGTVIFKAGNYTEKYEINQAAN